MKKKILAVSIIASIALFTGCGENSATENTSGLADNTNVTDTVTSTTKKIDDSLKFTIERGPVYAATVLDSVGQKAKFLGRGGIYEFESDVTYPITVTGGYIDIDRNGVINVGEVEMESSLTTEEGNVITIISTIASIPAFVESFNSIGIDLNSIKGFTTNESYIVAAISDVIYPLVVKDYNGSFIELSKVDFKDIGNSIKKRINMYKSLTGGEIYVEENNILNTMGARRLTSDDMSTVLTELRLTVPDTIDSSNLVSKERLSFGNSGIDINALLTDVSAYYDSVIAKAISNDLVYTSINKFNSKFQSLLNERGSTFTLKDYLAIQTELMLTTDFTYDEFNLFKDYFMGLSAIMTNHNIYVPSIINKVPDSIIENAKRKLVVLETSFLNTNSITSKNITILKSFTSKIQRLLDYKRTNFSVNDIEQLALDSLSVANSQGFAGFNTYKNIVINEMTKYSELSTEECAASFIKTNSGVCIPEDKIELGICQDGFESLPSGACALIPCNKNEIRNTDGLCEINTNCDIGYKLSNIGICTLITADDCIDGYETDLTGNCVLSCLDGYHLATDGTCKLTCNVGEFLNAAGTCEISCSTGYKLNAAGDTCELTCDPSFGDDGTGTCVRECQDGETLDVAHDQCIPICAYNEDYNFNINACEAVCKDGFTFNNGHCDVTDETYAKYTKLLDNRQFELIDKSIEALTLSKDFYAWAGENYKYASFTSISEKVIVDDINTLKDLKTEMGRYKTELFEDKGGLSEPKLNTPAYTVNLGFNNSKKAPSSIKRAPSTPIIIDGDLINCGYFDTVGLDHNMTDPECKITITCDYLAYDSPTMVSGETCFSDINTGVVKYRTDLVFVEWAKFFEMKTIHPHTNVAIPTHTSVKFPTVSSFYDTAYNYSDTYFIDSIVEACGVEKYKENLFKDMIGNAFPTRDASIISVLTTMKDGSAARAVYYDTLLKNDFGYDKGCLYLFSTGK